MRSQPIETPPYLVRYHAAQDAGHFSPWFKEESLLQDEYLPLPYPLSVWERLRGAISRMLRKIKTNDNL